MAPLLLAALGWIGLHLLVAGPLRPGLVDRLGEWRFRQMFAVASALLLLALILSYRAAPFVPIWSPPQWAYVWAHLCMVPAFVLLALSLTDSPTGVLAGSRAFEPRGVFRITRHPMLWSFAIWAAVHVIGNGDTASLLFFGAFLLTALLGMPSIDAKAAARDPERWARFTARSSILPFGAIAAGRNRLVWREIGWLPPVLGLLLWVAVLHFHRAVFGVAPVIFG